MDTFKEGDFILVVWISGIDPESLMTIVDDIKVKTGCDASVENSEMLEASKHKPSTFDGCVLKCRDENVDIPLNPLAEILRVIKPSSSLIINNIISSDSVLSQLKLAGFIDVQYSDIDKQIKASKSAFEVGSTIQLSFGNKEVLNNSNKEKWKVDLLDPDVDLEDPDDLLTEDDKKKPDPDSLKVCGTTGKRKACKNCVCGLQEELDAEVNNAVEENKKEFKSSCGSCYLGDAFRCASCPYLGMPAFKPGEKVKLTDETLQDNV